MVPCLFCLLHVYSHDVLRLVASAPERKQAWNSLDIYGGDWQSLSCETQWSASDLSAEFLFTLLSTKFIPPIKKQLCNSLLCFSLLLVGKKLRLVSWKGCLFPQNGPTGFRTHLSVLRHTARA